MPPPPESPEHGPLVSVVIATYDRPDALARAIRSALAQTVADTEVVVAVEQGDAASVAVVAAIGDQRVRHVVNPRRNGPGPARDFGAARSTGRWVAFLDDDDEWHPAKLERQLALAGDDERVIVTCRSFVVGPEGTVVKPSLPYAGDRSLDEWLFDRRSWWGGADAMLQTSSLLMPRALFERLGFGAVQHEEWELAIRAVERHGYRLATVPEPLVTYHVGRTYSWEGSLAWARVNRDLLSPVAYSGFLLTVVTQGLGGPTRTRAFATLLRAGLAGRPTARQLFAFALIWLLPHPLRRRIRAIAAARRLRATARRSGLPSAATSVRA